MSRYAQREQDNDAQFNLLASKLTTLRSITEDINTQANNSDILDNMSTNFSSLMNSVKTSGSRLTRSMSSGNSVWRNVGIALFIFFIIWTLMRIF